MNLSRKDTYTKIKKDLDELTRELDNIKLLEELDTNKSSKLRCLIDYIDNEIIKCRVSTEELNNPFLLFIVGNGNYGKSTLINTLLKSKVIETADIPNTWKLDLFILGIEEKMDILYDNKEKRTHKLKKGSKILSLEETKYKQSKREVSNLIKEYKNKNSYTIEQLLSIKKQLDDEHIYLSDVCEVHYYLDNIEILKDFIIVDTPGLNQRLLNKTKDSMKYYYNRADGIIWLVDAQNVISKKSCDLIKEINEIGSLYGNNKNIIGVVNKMDIISQQGDENVEKVKIRVKEIYEEFFSDIVFISAKKGLSGITNNNNEDIIESNVDSLYELIDKNFKMKSEYKQIKSKSINNMIMRDEIIKKLDHYRRELYKDISRYNESEYDLKNKTQDIREYINRSLMSLKDRDYSNSTSPVKSILSDISDIEEMCNKSLSKMFNNLSITSNISKAQFNSNISCSISLYESKHLVLRNITNQQTNLNNKKTIKNNKITNYLMYKTQDNYATDSYTIKSNILKTIDNVIELIITELDEKLYEITYELNILREYSFRDYHFEFDRYSEFIEKTDSIVNILNKMG